jgi:hypothetical protein
VDTAYDVERAAALLEEGRLFDGEHPEAPIHGEGAAFLLMLRPDVAARVRSPVLASLEGAVLDEEVLPADAPVDGAGLTRTVRAHTAVLKKARAPLEWILADVNNEERRTREWLLALPRALAPGGLSTAGRDYVEVASPGCGRTSCRCASRPRCRGDADRTGPRGHRRAAWGSGRPQRARRRVGRAGPPGGGAAVAPRPEGERMRPC